MGATETENHQGPNVAIVDSSDRSAYLKSTESDSASNSTSVSTRIPYPELSGTDIGLARKLPYSVGFTTIATRHKPHHPYEKDYEADGSPVLENRKTVSQWDSRLLSPTISGKMLYQDTKALEITAIIRAGCKRGAQLVIVNNDIVAKIYDPLYYDDSDEFGFETDVVDKACSDYRTEAAAYQELQKSPAAQEVIPAFYGTWVIHVDTLKREGDQVWKYTRQVPLMLIEYVRGDTMIDINPLVLSEALRTSLMKKVMEIESIIFYAGVNHSDIHPRNVIIAGPPSHKSHDTPDELFVKVIDFNTSEIRRHPGYHLAEIQEKIQEGMDAWFPKLPSPFMRFYRSLDDFACRGWCPNDDPELDDHVSSLWLWKQIKDDERYIPVIWDPTDPWTRPKYVKFRHTSPSSSDSGVNVDMEGTKKRKSCED